MSAPERWLPVVGYEGLYAVSDLGRVKSFHNYGRWKAGPEGRLLAIDISKSNGYATVNLSLNGKQKLRTVHSLVLEAFDKPCPPGMECRHEDGNRANARLSNLRWGTGGENNLDQVRHGTHNNARKEECPKGHEYTEENTYYYRRADGSIKQRACKICRQDWREQWSPAASGKTCTEGDCTKPVLAKDLCQRHYHQQRRETKRKAA